MHEEKVMKQMLLLHTLIYRTDMQKNRIALLLRKLSIRRFSINLKLNQLQFVLKQCKLQ